MTINELRAKRAQAWDGAQAFLDARRNEKGVLSAEDDAAYTAMEKDIEDLGKEIRRLERQREIENELNRPTAAPLVQPPQSASAAETAMPRATDAYKKAFWNAMRSRQGAPAVSNVLQIGADGDGGYLVPDEFEHTLVDALQEENIFRQLAKTIQTSSGDRAIPVVASHGTAEWMDENALVPESDDKFSQLTISAYKLGTFIRLRENRPRHLPLQGNGAHDGGRR